MTMPSSENQHFLLKWNNHRSNMINVFESLLAAESLVDVTLAVEGRFLKAHKIVLSACSPYFQAMFVSQAVDKHPILIFHDIKFAHLKTLLDFMYRGEISIDEKELSDVLKVAEALSIRGLSSFESDDDEGEEEKKPPVPTTADDNHRNFSPKPHVADSSNGTGNSSDAPKNKTPLFDPNQPPQKKRRGRQPMKKNIPALNQIKPNAITNSQKNKRLTVETTVGGVGRGRGVRRRIPRKYLGGPGMKREKLSDSDGSVGEEGEDLLRLLPHDIGGSEPLFEMSVRGLDLFKYASIEGGLYRCIECEKMRIPKTFKNKYSFQRHAFLYHEGNARKVFPCPVCSREFSRPDKMKNHLRSIHQTAGSDDHQTPVSTNLNESSGKTNDNCDF